MLIDFRPLEQYTAAHLACAISLPLTTAQSIPGALPPRSVPQLIALTCPQDYDATSTLLVTRLQYPSCTICTSISDAAVAWRSARRGGGGEQDDDDHDDDKDSIVDVVVDTTAVIDRSRRCWEPNGFLLETVTEMETILGGPAHAVDIGCGTGRDMVFLAMRGWAVTGLDNRRKLLQQALQLGEHHGVMSSLTSVNQHVVHSYAFRPASLDLVVVCRFLHRPSLCSLLSLPRIGGLLLYSHFLDGCQHTAVGTPTTSAGFFFQGELEALLTNQEIGYETNEEERNEAATSTAMARRAAGTKKESGAEVGQEHALSGVKRTTAAAAGYDYRLLRREVSKLADGRPMVHVLAQRIF